MPLGNAPRLGTSRFRRADFVLASGIRGIAKSAWFLNGTVYTKSIAGSIPLSGAIKKHTLRKLSAAITASGSLKKNLNFATLLRGSITASGSVRKLTKRTLMATLTASGTISKRAGKKLAGSITLSATLAKGFLLRKTVVGAITALGSLATQINIYTPLPPYIHNSLTGLRRFLGKH